MSVSATKQNALTVDVEDYYHVSAFDKYVSRNEWDQYPSRVVANTRRLLELFEQHHAHATFFVLGWVGERYPGLVREIQAAGHEIGCHSYWHQLVYQQTPEEFREDLRRARDILQGAIGGPVKAYRAPSWSIVEQSKWALEILVDEGFSYDSSIFPIYHDRYGMPHANRFPHTLEIGGRRLREFPPSVLRLVGVNFPVCGGGYFRLYPASWTAYCLRRINQRALQPFLFYLHPWELDPDQPRIAVDWRTKWRHYLNISETEKKLHWLLGQFHFDCMSKAFESSNDDG